MKKKYIWILVIVAVLIGIRIALPYLLEQRINKSLDGIDGYQGSLRDVDLHLYRGGFVLNDLQIFEEASETPDIPLVDLPRLDFSIQWSALFQGKFVGEVYMDSLFVNFSKPRDEARVDSSNNRFNLISEIQKFNPININVFEITNGGISYIDPTTQPKIDVTLEDFFLRAENLSNVENESQKLPAKLEVRSTTMDSGSISLDVQLNYLKDPPDFNYDLKIERISIPRFNEFFEVYANLDADAGELNFYSEGKARDGELEGYAKPLIENLKIGESDPSDGLFQKIYEGLIGVGTNIFENNKEDQIGTKIPFSGSLAKADADVMETIWNFLRNAFFEAYNRELEQTINFETEANK
jgi:hypothetical protein